jgi:hypothetical protein
MDDVMVCLMGGTATDREALARLLADAVATSRLRFWPGVHELRVHRTPAGRSEGDGLWFRVEIQRGPAGG